MAVETPTAEAPASTAALRRQAVRGGALLLGARLVVQVFQWAITLVVARLLLPDDYGMMTSGAIFVGLSDMLTEAGVNKALVQRRKLEADDLAQGFTLSLLLATALYAVLFCLAPYAANYLERPDFALFLRVLALTLFLIPLRSVTGALLERDLRLGKQSAVQVGGALVQALLVLALALAGMGYWALATGTLLGKALEAVWTWHASGWRVRLALPGRHAWELLRFGIHVSVGSLLWYAYFNADFAVVGALFGTVTLGYYSLAFQLMKLPADKLSAHVNYVMFAVFCKIQDDRDRVRDWFLRVTSMLNFVAAPGLIGMALVAEDAIPLLLGERWRPAVLPFQLLCPVGILMMTSSALFQTIVALGRPDVPMKYNVACAVLYPPAFLAAGWAFGVVGVCVAWLVLNPLLVATVIHLTRHLTGLNLTTIAQANLPVLAGVAFMAVCVLGVRLALPGDERAGLRLGVGIATGAAAYTAWMLLTARHTVLADVRALWHDLRGRGPEVATES